MSGTQRFIQIKITIIMIIIMNDVQFYLENRLLILQSIPTVGIDLHLEILILLFISDFSVFM